MLDANEILLRITAGENYTTEFKRDFAAEPIRKGLVAFANDYGQHDGGVFVVGVADNGEIVGVSDMDETILKITNVCRDGQIVPTLMPVIYPVKIENKTVVVVEMPRSGRRPHRVNNLCYIRIGSSNRQATSDEEFELIRRSGQLPYDLAPVREANVSDLDMDRFMAEFLPRRVSPEMLALNGRTPAEWLEHLKLAYHEGGRCVPTVAALLLFGRNPQQYLPQAAIDFIRFEGEDASYPIADRKEIGGSLRQQIEVGVELVMRYTVQGYQFSDKSPVRKDTVEYPLRAIREAIANAVAHRDYEFSNTRVSIKMFDDRVEILSPGGLFGIVTRQNFGTGINDYRNPTIAVGLNVQGLVEKAGTGILSIKRQMRENGALEPIFDLGDKYLVAKLPAHPYYYGVRLYKNGLQALASEANEIDAAIGYFRRAIALFPDLAEAWAELGRAYSLQNNLLEARNAYQMAVQKSPRFERAYIDWAKMEELAGEIHSSLLIYQQGLKELPLSFLFLYNAGMLEKRNKNWVESMHFLQKAATIQPESTFLQAAITEVQHALKESNR